MPIWVLYRSNGHPVDHDGGTEILDRLVAAGLARRETVKDKILLVADEPRSGRLSLSLDQAPALPFPTLGELNVVTAEIDRLLASSSG